MTEIYDKNLRLLGNKHPELYNALLKHSPEGTCREIPTPSGYPTLLCLPPNGEPIFLHSPEDPVKEADSLLEGFKFKGEDVTILMGFGLGYLPLAIARRMDPEHRLFIVEASSEILLKACQLVDLSPLFLDDRVHIFGTDQVQLIWDQLEREQLKVLGGEVIKLICPPCQELFREAYRDIEDKIERFVVALKESFHTLEIQWEQTVENVLGNLLSLADAAAIDPLFRLAEGHPALVVAAGPSLDKNIGEIKGAEDRFLIIAVDSALKPLIAEGIKPDLVVSVDPNPNNLKKFDRIPSHLLNQLPLVFSPLVYHEIPQRFRGGKFVFGAPNRLSQWALALRGPVAEFPYGFTVTHHAFYLARAMGVHPIIFVGLDLAFSTEGDHAKHCATNWNIDLTREDLPLVPGVHGDKVPTCPGFAKMITLFEREIARTEARCIDATEGGALIQGTELMTLQEVIDCWGQEKVPASPMLLQQIWSENRPKGRDGVRAGLRWLLDQAGEMQRHCKAALSLLMPLLLELDRGLDGGPGAGEKIQKVNRIADQVNRCQEFTEVIKDQMGDILINQNKLRFQLQRAKDEREKLSLEVQKSHLFFERVGQVVERIRRFGMPVLEQMEGNLSALRQLSTTRDRGRHEPL